MARSRSVRLRLIGIALLALAALLLLEASQNTRPIAAAGATLALPGAGCGDSAGADFSWSPLGGGQQQWLDVSLNDDGFQPDTFIGNGPLDPGASSFRMNSVVPGVPLFWRVNTLTASGWETSDTGTFVPCGGPVLLWGPLACEDNYNATVDFHWSPMAAPGGFQYLDLSFDPNFAPGNFAGSGPFPPETSSYHFQHIQANVTYFFRVNELGADNQWHTSQTGSFNAQCAPSISHDIYGSPDVLYSADLGINAPVNVRDIDFDGAMGNPVGPEDVVRYNFVLFPGLGGYPGSGGTTMIAGHVDYHDYGLAVFAPLRKAAPGMTIQYQRYDGAWITYVIDWVEDLPPDYDWTSLAVSGNPESLVLITCNGTFDFASRSYDKRRVVHAVIQTG